MKSTDDLSTRIRNYGNVCWWASEMIQPSAFSILISWCAANLAEPTSPSGAGFLTVAIWIEVIYPGYRKAN
jgi:hypothetical protein